MQRKGKRLSQALQDAQKELEAARKRFQSDQKAGDQGALPQRSSTDSSQAPLSSLPDHLGWGSGPLTAALKSGPHRFSPSRFIPGKEASHISLEQVDPGHRESRSAEVVGQRLIRVYPYLAMALLRKKMAAPGRIWLLLKHLDEEGRGWLERREVETFLTEEGSAYRICGRRQLRKLLSKGDDLFWQRAGDRIWFRSTAKVSAKLGVVRLGGHPVSMPLASLLEGIGGVRANLYACYHSGQVDKNGQPKPMARITLEKLSSRSPRTQRAYELRSGIERQKNFAVGGRAKKKTIEDRAWRHGRALFIYKDNQARFGPAGAAYTAWQLPNSYKGPYAIRPTGRQKSINREIADLFMKGITGNSDLQEAGRGPKRYFNSGQAAAKIYNLDPTLDRYWKGSGRSRQCKQIWHVFAGQSEEGAGP